MSSTLRVCLYNVEPGASDELHTHLGALNYVRLIAEVNSPEQLATLLTEAGVNLVFFHLDPSPESVIEVIDQVAGRYPELAMIALSHDTRPEAILAPIRSGCDQFVCEPIDDADLSAAVARVASKRLLSRASSRCVCVAGATGGAGSTSLACNLAMEIADLVDRPCALVDLDLQFGDVAVYLDAEPKYTFYDLATAGSSIDRSLLDSVMTRLPCKVAVLPRPELLDQHVHVTADLVHNTIEVLAAEYESVIVDVPRVINPCTFAALSQADLVLIVCQLCVPSIRNAKRYYESLVRAGVPDERIEVVVNRGDSGSGRISIADLEELIKKPVYAVIPNDYHFVARSLDFGQPLAFNERKNPIRRKIHQMAQKIVGTPDGEQQAVQRGLFSRLLSK